MAESSRIKINVTHTHARTNVHTYIHTRWVLTRTGFKAQRVDVRYLNHFKGPKIDVI